MSLFAEYIYPLTEWVKAHPNWALLVTFFISFAESVAIIGSIIPGSVTMTAIGILAGSGLMRIDLTIVAAALGAVAGDSSSYLIGYTFHDRICSFWPFSSYPQWLTYGKDYFTKHGGKSVLIGRFIGPLRSIIPVIAGMVQMEQWRFFLANFISAIGWAMLYVAPGIFIGAASTELPPESATRLFLLILVILASIWLLSLLIKWLFIKLNHLLLLLLENFWGWSARRIYLAKILKLLTPLNETNHHLTATYILLLVLTTLLFSLLIIVIISNHNLTSLNDSVFLFLQSLRTPIFYSLFIAINQTLMPITLILFGGGIGLIIIYYRDWRAFFYWLGLFLICTIILLLINTAINYPRPTGLLKIQGGNSFPNLALGYSTALITALIFWLQSSFRSPLTPKTHALNLQASAIWPNNNCGQIFYFIATTRIINFCCFTLLVILLLQGFSSLYIGDNWFTDNIGAYLCGFNISLLLWLFYRRQVNYYHNKNLLSVALLFLLLFATIFSSILYYKQSWYNHQQYLAEYEIKEELWWQPQRPILPIYRYNRIGRARNFFNIQYVGSLQKLEQTLITAGWQKQNNNFLSILLSRMSWKQTGSSMSLISPLYLNRKPAIIMSYQPHRGNLNQILNIWQSNYYLKNFHQQIWIGTIQPQKSLAFNPFSRRLKNQKFSSQSINLLSAALPKFSQLRISLPTTVTKELAITVVPVILLIKERAKRIPNIPSHPLTICTPKKKRTMDRLK